MRVRYEEQQQKAERAHAESLSCAEGHIASLRRQAEFSEAEIQRRDESLDRSVAECQDLRQCLYNLQAADTRKADQACRNFGQRAEKSEELRNTEALSNCLKEWTEQSDRETRAKPAELQKSGAESQRLREQMEQSEAGAVVMAEPLRKTQGQEAKAQHAVHNEKVDLEAGAAE